MSSVLLIDGYNLLWAANITADGPGASTLAGSRGKLLSFLAQFLPEGESARTTVVFDAAQAPPGLPRSATFRGVQIFFATDHDDADAMLEELIAGHPSPRRLTVVSSDHRVQNAARRRRATAIDSDVWFRTAASRSRRASQSVSKPTEPVSPGEADAWLAQFGLAGEITELLDAPAVNRWGDAHSLPPAHAPLPPSSSKTAKDRTRGADSPEPPARRPRGRMKGAEPPKKRPSVDLDADVLAEAERLAGEGQGRAALSPHEARWRSRHQPPAKANSSPPAADADGRDSTPPRPSPSKAERKQGAGRPTKKAGRPSAGDVKKKPRRPPTIGDDVESFDAGFNPFPEGYGDDLFD